MANCSTDDIVVRIALDKFEEIRSRVTRIFTIRVSIREADRFLKSLEDKTRLYLLFRYFQELFTRDAENAWLLQDHRPTRASDHLLYHLPATVPDDFENPYSLSSWSKIKAELAKDKWKPCQYFRLPSYGKHGLRFPPIEFPVVDRPPHKWLGGQWLDPNDPLNGSKPKLPLPWFDNSVIAEALERGSQLGVTWSFSSLPVQPTTSGSL